MPKIRPARAKDAEAIRAIYNDAVAKTTATFDLTPRSRSGHRKWMGQHGARWPLIVLEEKGSVVGWACVSQWSTRCAYDDSGETSVYLSETARGRGLGKSLLASLLKTARKRGFHTLLARIAEGNPASIALHERFGFKDAGVLREVGFKFGRRLDVAILQKML